LRDEQAKWERKKEKERNKEVEGSARRKKEVLLGMDEAHML
jgi:hypothetical protein